MTDRQENRVIIAGGTGLVGTRLVKKLLEQGANVQVLSRDPHHAHLPEGAQAHTWEELPGLLEGSHAVINLAGAGIADRRWSSVRKKLLFESRIAATRSILSALHEAKARPSIWINASAIGIYGTRGETAVDEAQTPGEGFLAELCQAWEAATEPAKHLGIRTVKLRLGPVLAREGGALPRLALPVRFFVGSVLGSGHQGFSWIHLEDLVALILECLRNPAFEGPINATAPNPCSQEVFTRLLAKRLHRPVCPIPGFLTGAAVKLLLGEMAESMLLGGAYVHPQKALDLGFSFRFSQAQDALEDLL